MKKNTCLNTSKPTKDQHFRTNLFLIRSELLYFILYILFFFQDLHLWGRSETGKVLAVMQNTIRAENHFLSPLLICKNVFSAEHRQTTQALVSPPEELHQVRSWGGGGRSQSFSPSPLHPWGPADNPCSASPLSFWTPGKAFYPKEKCRGAPQLVPSPSTWRWHRGGVPPLHGE